MGWGKLFGGSGFGGFVAGLLGGGDGVLPRIDPGVDPERGEILGESSEGIEYL